MDFSARYVFIKPPPSEIYQSRLLSSGLDDTSIQNLASELAEEMDGANTSQLFDTTIANDVGAEDGAKLLGKYIFSKTDAVNGGNTTGGDDPEQQGEEGTSTTAVAVSTGTGDDVDSGESMEDVPAEETHGNHDIMEP
jgi:hypothetical protein